MKTIWITLFSLVILGFLWGCGGGGGSEVPATTGAAPDQNGTQDEGWKKAMILGLTAGGMFTPDVSAMMDQTNGKLHLAYFSETTGSDDTYSINHLEIDTSTMTAGIPVSVMDVDNCRALGLSMSLENNPVIAYQGGRVRDCGSEQQSDVMFSREEGNSWKEYTGGIGYVERNPVFQDGLAGKTISSIVDSNGDIHLAYQFFYEGCDSHNFNYPDLLYVKIDGSNPGATSPEETVEGNEYSSQGMATKVNDVGEKAVICLDSDGDPVIFYAADLSPNSSDSSDEGLRAARKKNGVWQKEWVDTGISVGRISCAMDNNHKLSVAYYVSGEYTDSLGTHNKCLKYAKEGESGWKVSLVDESKKCGDFCSLAFDNSGNPSIAYFAEENNSGSLSLKDLWLASFDGTIWKREEVASNGDIGRYNTLMFGQESGTYIISYSSSDSEILLFYK